MQNYLVNEHGLLLNRDIFVYAFEPSTVHKDFLVNAAFSTATAQSLLKFLSHLQDEEKFVHNMESSFGPSLAYFPLNDIDEYFFQHSK